MTDQFDLTADQREIQDLARRFTADRITPFAAEWDETHHYPVDVWKAAGDLGFGSIYVSEESGGPMAAPPHPRPSRSTIWRRG
jgi:alkylation response protein AidB-like acyl-CoA dehydrogenase